MSGTIALQHELPNFSTDISINGSAGGIIISGDSDGNGCVSADVPLFAVTGGAVNISNLTLAKGKGIEGANGALGMDGGLGTGAITTRGGALNLSGCTLNGNVGGKGGDAGDFFNADLGHSKYGAGALEIRGGTVSLTNCTVVGNTGGAGGSGVHTMGGSAPGSNGVGTINVNGGSLSVNQSTIAGNAGGAGGPGSGNGRTDGGGISSGGSTTKLNNSIVVGNIGGNLAGNAPAGKYNVTSGTLEDVKLGSLANNGGSTQTMVLLEGSMAINAGDPGVTGGTDQRGEARVKRGRMDIGAYESDFMPVNQVPTDINLSGNSVEENKDAGTTVGTFSSVDFNGDDSFTYALVGENNDNSSFAINGDVLKTAAKFNYKTKKSYLIRVQTDDGNGGTFAKDFTINVKQTPPLVVTTTNDIVADDDLTSLREAINFANSNRDLSEITFAPGISGTLALQSALPDFSTDIRIIGPAAGIVISGDKDGNGTPDVPLFTVAGYTTSLFNLTLAKGKGTEGTKGSISSVGEPGSGAITVRGTLNLSGCTLTGNVGGKGGDGGNQPQSNGFSTGNAGSGKYGAGALEVNYGNVSLTNCTVTNNVGGAGGNTGFSQFGFASGGNGVGTINVSEGNLTVNQSTIVGNSGGYGGISLGNGPNPDLNGFTYGGGISNARNTTTLNNSLVLENSGGNLMGNESGTNNIIGGTRASIKLGPLAPNGGPTPTIALLEGSPAINAGAPNFNGTGQFDQRGEGYARVAGGRLDIGAFESSFALNRAPSALALSGTSVPENQNAGTIVGTLSTTDADSGDSFTYSLVEQDNDNAWFAIEGDALKTKAAFDYETKNSYFIRVQTDDGRGGTFQRSFRISVTNLNEETPSLVVTTLQDVEAEDGQTSLREAMNYANSDPDASAITFAANLNGALTLRAGGGVLPFVTTPVAIDGAGRINIVGDEQHNILRVEGGDLTLRRMIVRNGSGASGGGLLVRSNGRATLEACEFRNNTGALGGAVYVETGATFVARDSTFSGNSSYSDSTLSLRGNSDLYNCTLAGNVASLNTPRGAIAVYATVRVFNCTVVGNTTASGTGGAVSVAMSGSFSATNTLFAANGDTPFDGFNNPTSAGDANHNFSFDTLAEANLGALADNGGPTPTMALLAGSPAINAGDPDFDGTNQFDQRGQGFARIKGGTIDVGAYEVQNSAPTLANASFDATVGAAFSTQLAGADAEGDTLSYALTAGTLPTGLSLSEGGLIAGTPTQSGASVVTVTVDDGKGGAGNAQITISVAVTPLSLRAAANLTATPSSGTVAPSIALKWKDNSQGESGYKVTRRTGTNGRWVLIARVETPDLTSFVDKDVAPPPQTPLLLSRAAFQSARERRPRLQHRQRHRHPNRVRRAQTERGLWPRWWVGRAELDGQRHRRERL